MPKSKLSLPSFAHGLRALRSVALLGALIIGAGIAHGAVAADLPLAAGSPLVGITFEDKPLLLPVQRNFQMAMLTASSELQRSCGRMEAYGWRMGQGEQARVDQVFGSTVERLRGFGYAVESQVSHAVSNDVTLFTADRNDRHFLFMWSAGEIGLVMVLCETSVPAAAAPSVQSKPFPQDVMTSQLMSPAPTNRKPVDVRQFTPVGQWVGSYTCGQGYTGATLQIDHMSGENFQGVFRFYPTPHNPTMPKGSYAVSGQYDYESQRILINPGKWLERPKNFFNTVMVGSFDAVNQSFSAYFQGIMGCTSFEAKYVDGSTPTVISADKKAAAHKAKKVHKKAAVHKAKKKDVVKEKTETLPLGDASPALVAPLAPDTAPAPTAPAVAPTNAVAPITSLPPATPADVPAATAAPTPLVKPAAVPAGDVAPEPPKDLPKDTPAVPAPAAGAGASSIALPAPADKK